MFTAKAPFCYDKKQKKDKKIKKKNYEQMIT